MNGSRMYWNMHDLIRGLVSLLMLTTGFTAGTCPPKLPPGGTLKPTFTVGEVAELKCDVSARNASSDTLYWKHGNGAAVMSENMNIMPSYRKKFSVSLKGSVYTLKFVVELNDVGKYACTCGFKKLEYHLWVKTPCNGCKFVTSESSLDVIRTCKNGSITTLQTHEYNSESEAFGVALNCGCTYPGSDRKFTWRWKMQNTTSSTPTVPEKLGKAVTFVQPELKATGCYTAPDSVTYRFQNITTKYNDTFRCPYAKPGLYSLYMDDEDGSGAEPVYKVCCQEGHPECPLLPLISCFIVAAVADLICIIIAVYAIWTWRRSFNDRVRVDPWKGLLYVLIVVIIIQIIILLSLIIVSIVQAQGGYAKNIVRNCELIECDNAVGGAMIVGLIILCIISCGIIGFVAWQVYTRVKNKKDYNTKGTSRSVDSHLVLTTTASGQDTSERQDLNSPQAAGATNSGDKSEIGAKDSQLSKTFPEAYRKKDSISEDEGVHVGGEVPPGGDGDNVDSPVPV